MISNEGEGHWVGEQGEQNLHYHAERCQIRLLPVLAGTRRRKGR